MAASPLPDPPGAASLVLAADDPDRLAAFYGGLLGHPAQRGLGPGHWRLALPGGGLLEIYAPSRRRPVPRQRGRLALCLRGWGGAELLESWIARACQGGGRLEEGPRQEPFGWEAWLADPEDNRLLLLVLPPGPGGSAAPERAP